MNAAAQLRQYHDWLHTRAVQANQRIPGMEMLVLEHLAGPDGAHYFLFVTTETEDQIREAKRRARNAWDVTGFSIIRIKPMRPNDTDETCPTCGRPWRH